MQGPVEQELADCPRLRHEVAALVEGHLGLARALASRYARRGEPVEDLEQVAMLALVKAARRFDSTRGVPFAGYATPSILGELKRHFRDRAWTMRVPRSTQDRYLQVVAERDALAHEQGAVPTVAAIAERLGCSTEDVIDAMEAGDNYRPASIEALSGARRDRLPSDEGGFEHAIDRVGLVAAMARLDDEERRVLALRFVDDWPQRRIAAELGVSQMHVSRLLDRLFVRLREDLRG